jgi:hypothetical protein
MQIGRFFILFLICSFFSTAAQAVVVAMVDRNQVSEFDLVTLTVRISGRSTEETPDFTALERDFDIVDTQNQKSSSISFINGKQTSSIRTDYVLTLRAKRLGRLTIPSIRVGQETTSPIPIQAVQQSAAATRQMNQLVFFDTSVDTNSTYVQGQILYKVKLFYSESISGDFPPPPRLEDAVIETIESERRYESTVNNRRYYVLEKQYAIFPQKSGVLTIPREAFVGSRGRGGLFSSRQRVNAVSEAHTINVSTFPAGSQGTNWIPAKQFTLQEAWAENPPIFRVGEPVNRILTMTAVGLAASLLPPLAELELANAKTYADPPESSEQASNVGIIASNRTTVGIVPIEEGQLTLPEISIPWWNTQTDRPETATIPEATYQVLPSLGGVSVAPSIPMPTAQPSTPIISEAAGPNPWMYGTFVLGFLLLVAIWQWFRLRSRLNNLIAQSEPEETTFIVPDEGRVFKELSSACKAGDASNAHRNLLLWSKSRFPQVSTIRELAQIFDHPTLLETFQALEHELYSQDPHSTWSGTSLLEAITEIRNMKEVKTKSSALIGELNPV